MSQLEPFSKAPVQRTASSTLAFILSSIHSSLIALIVLLVCPASSAFPANPANPGNPANPTSPATGEEVPEVAGEPVHELTLERIFSREPLVEQLPAERLWRPGAGTWLYLRYVGGGVQEVVEIDPVDHSECVLLDSVELADAAGRAEADDGDDADEADQEQGTERPVPRLTSLQISPDGSSLLLSDGDDLVLVDLATVELTRLGTGDGAEELVSFDPTGRRLAYVRDNNLLVFDLPSRSELRLSDDGSDTVTNGILDWVYEEELAGRSSKAYAWAPDGSAILWLRLDDTEIPPYHLVNVMSTHSRLDVQRYPYPGDPAPAVSLRLARLGPTLKVVEQRQIVPEDPTAYLPRFGFLPDSGSLWYQVLDNGQNRLELRQVDLADASTKTRLVEEDPYWIEPVDMMHLMADGSVLWASRRDGYTHLYMVPPEGPPLDLTPGEGDVTDLLGVDESRGMAWIQAARPDHRQRHLFRVNLSDGSMQQLTSGRGTWSGTLSPDAEWLAAVSSTAERPPRIDLLTAAEGLEVAPLIEPDCSELDALQLGSRHFVTVEADDGVPLDVSILQPPLLEPGRRYPVVIYTYGGPHVQLVRDSWSRNGFFHQWLVQQGVLVVSVDNRGAAGRGRDFEGAVDQALGSSQLPDVLAAVRWLAAQPYVDADHIGIWGWSYGGYMSAYALTHAPGVFAAGVAVAPVTDWRLYDSVYTERYMGTPESNPDGYESGSVLEAIAALEDPLLVIHGTGDDNVHLQNTLQLADRAWKAGVRFDLMLFPGLKHGIFAPGSQLQVFSRIADHLLEHLAPQAGPAEH